MADEAENHTLALLREMRAEIRERFEKVDAEAAAAKAELKAEVLKLRAEVAEGTSAVKSVALRLTLIEQRLKDLERV
jgi:ribosomal protein L9